MCRPDRQANLLALKLVLRELVDAMFFELTGERWIGDVVPVNEPWVRYSMDTSNADSVYVEAPQAGRG
jgi:hypothetical protein